MTYSMSLGATIVPKPWETRGDCYAACEQECINENGGLWLPLVNDYCAASCFDDSGCEDLPFSPPDPDEDWHDVTLPPKAPADEPSISPTKPPSTKPKPGSSSTKTGGAKPTTEEDDDQPSPVAPSGTKIGLVLLGIAGVIAGGVWLMRRKRR